MFYNVQQSTEVYLYIGGSGSYSNYSNQEGGWSGGGKGSKSGASGGGATDIRLISGSWSDETSLKSRIIVAGGGGGAYAGETYRSVGGDGGGEKGTLFTVEELKKHYLGQRSRSITPEINHNGI